MAIESSTIATALAPLSEGKVGKKSTLDLIFEALPSIEAAIDCGNSYALIAEHLCGAGLELTPKLLSMYVSRARKRRDRQAARHGTPAARTAPARLSQSTTPAPAPAAAPRPSLQRPAGIIPMHEIDFNLLR